MLKYEEEVAQINKLFKRIMTRLPQLLSYWSRALGSFPPGTDIIQTADDRFGSEHLSV